jgi:hypothetical protein
VAGEAGDALADAGWGFGAHAESPAAPASARNVLRLTLFIPGS